MAESLVTGASTLGNSLESFLCCDEIVPGAEPSYQICKTILLYHPLGQKLAESPIRYAQAQDREITISYGAEDEIREAFNDQWARDGATNILCNWATIARAYGISSLALVNKDGNQADPLDVNTLATAEIAFSVFDPLNTAGSLVLNQDPNAFDFQKHQDIAVNGKRYHRSRTVTLMNENPIYIAWTSSAFGFVGRSVYQRALFPLKSFIQTMRADDMVARKAGLIVAALKMASSVIDKVMAVGAAFKRQLLQRGMTDNILSIAEGETVTSLDLTNLADPLNVARIHILENIAAADDMPAKMLNNETFAEGFGEGVEDAKRVASYIETKQKWMRPGYDFMDMVVQRRAWNEEFYETLKDKYPEQYAGVGYTEFFYRTVNSFKAAWPSLIREPESELIKVDEQKFKAAIGVVELILPIADPVTKGTLVQWIADLVSANKKLFPIPLLINAEDIENYEPPMQVLAGGDAEKEHAPPRPEADSTGTTLEAIGSRTTSIEHFLRRNGRAISLLTRSGRRA
jgi:hypothetical protein